MWITDAHVPRTITLVGILLVLFVFGANATTFYSLPVRAAATVTTPNVILQSGIVANSTIFPGGTSAIVTTPTVNIATTQSTSKGTYLSGSLPSSVSAVDSDYYVTQSETQGTSQQVTVEFDYAVSSTSPTQLNLTIVQQYSYPPPGSGGTVTVTISIWNYTTPGFQTLQTYSPSNSTDQTQSFTFTNNPQSLTSSGQSVRVQIAATETKQGVSHFQQKMNLLQLYYYQQTYNYALKIVNQQTTSYSVRLNAASLTQTNLARLTNFTAWFNTTSPVQLQALSGGSTLTTSTGTFNTLSASSTILLAIRVTASGPGVSTVDSYLQVYFTGTNIFANYRLTLRMT